MLGPPNWPRCTASKSFPNGILVAVPLKRIGANIGVFAAAVFVSDDFAEHGFIPKLSLLNMSTSGRCSDDLVRRGEKRETMNITLLIISNNCRDYNTRVRV